MIRALEVYRATGEPLSHQQMQFDDGRRAEECRVFVLRRERLELHRRIERRVDAMIEAGLVDEVRGLTADGKLLGRTASQAVGYREALQFLAGEIDAAEMLAQMKVRTRRFAKRQGTWFRSLSECRFVEVAGELDAAVVADELVRAGRAALP
jgi:tRNA dimethylallyltransferase